MKTIVKILMLLVIVLGYLYTNDRSFFDSVLDQLEVVNESTIVTKEESSNDKILSSLYENQSSGVQVMGSGRVIRILPTDNDGSRHQRFIIRLSSGQTILISHNIDLAPNIDSLSENDDITFYGEYEWNSDGGVVHWTHEDPNGRHVGGWIVHYDQTYK